MSKDKFSKSISWEDLKSMGNPENSDIPGDDINTKEEMGGKTLNDAVRIYIERKGRGGKTVTLIKGLTLASPQLQELCKTVKARCGVGGKVEGRQIMIQGDQRNKVIKTLVEKGYKDVKNAGA